MIVVEFVRTWLKGAGLEFPGFVFRVPYFKYCFRIFIFSPRFVFVCHFSGLKIQGSDSAFQDPVFGPRAWCPRIRDSGFGVSGLFPQPSYLGKGVQIPMVRGRTTESSQ